MKESREQRENKMRIFRKIVAHMLEDKDKGMQEFYYQYGKFIIAVVKSICNKSHKVDEAVNNTLVKIWSSRANLSKVKKPEAWIYAANCAKDMVKAEKTLPLNENIVSGKDGLKEFFEENYFLDTIKNLNETERQIMIMKFSARYTFREIGLFLKMPTQSVSSIYYRALDKLKKEKPDGG